MAATATNEWKVGAFIVSGVVLAIAALFWLGVSRFDEETIDRVTYVDESVQGLEIGAPVKVRGVTIGKVDDIRLAPDHRLVEIHMRMRVSSLLESNAVERAEDVRQGGEAPSDLRTVVASQGITGIKFIEVDFFPPATAQIDLSFDPPRNYIPSAPSTLKSLEDAVRGIGDEVPSVVREIRALVLTLEERIAQLDTERLSGSISGVADSLRATLDGSARSGLYADVRGLIEELKQVAATVDDAVRGLVAEGGALDRTVASAESIAADVQRLVTSLDTAVVDAQVGATAESIRGGADSIGRLATGLEPTAADLPSVLRDLSRALRRVEALAELLERDPGALLRGRQGQ